jgi:3-deoxy-D-manno-octulosonic-acid transferase
MGPHYANFRTITDDLRAHKGLAIASKDDLAQTLAEILSNPTEAAAMGARARRVFEAQAGATQRSVDAVRAILAQGPAV